MKIIQILCIIISNFKGIRNLRIDFGNHDVIHGANGTGKTTVNDAFSWVLFGKDSLNRQKFDLRPKDEKPGENLETSVFMELKVTGEEGEQKCSLKRINTEKRVRKRGTTEDVSMGFTNSFEINGVPKSEAEYKAFIANIINEDEFKLLTNPSYFMDMDMKKRRAMLIALCGDLSDATLLDEAEDDYSIAREDILTLGLDDAKMKANKEYKYLTDKVKEYPPRISEAEQMIPDYIDVADLIKQRDESIRKMEGIEAEIASLERSTSSVELNRKRNELTIRANELAAVSRKTLADEKERLHGVFLALQHNNMCYTNDTMKASSLLRIKQDEIRTKETEITGIEAKIHLAETAVFSLNGDGKCSMCGQMLPAAQVEAKRQKFEADKENNIKLLKAMLSKAQMEHGVLQTKCNVLAKNQADANALAENSKKQMDEAEKEYRRFGTEPDMNSNITYNSVLEEIAGIDEQLSKIGETEAKLKDLRAQADSVRYVVHDLSYQITNGENENAHRQKLQTHVEELKADYRETGQEIATLECKIDELEEFSWLRSRKISERCNALFTVVHVEMFEKQINGGVREICDISYNGVNYSGSLNNGHRIVAGLDVIRAFQTARGVYAPIFLDNAESINDFNIPPMQCQMILLKVDDNKELKIERNAW